jgi:hypothetical protein
MKRAIVVEIELTQRGVAQRPCEASRSMTVSTLSCPGLVLFLAHPEDIAVFRRIIAKLRAMPQCGVRVLDAPNTTYRRT